MRIEVVNDVMAAVEAMRRVILSKRAHEIAWVAYDGVATEILSLDKIGPRLTNIVVQRMKPNG